MKKSKAVISLFDLSGEAIKPWFEGPTGITLADPVAYADPIPYRGQLGIFQTRI